MSRAARGVILIFAAFAGSLAGCTNVNIVVEELQQPFNRHAARDTAVLTAAELQSDEMIFVANGDSYYDYPGYYDPADFYPPAYGPWYHSRLYNVAPLTEPYYYEVFLSVRVRGFPQRGERRTLSPGDIAVVFARLDEGIVLTRLRLETAKAEAWWEKDRPAVTFEARQATDGAEYRQRQGDTLGEVKGGAVTLLLAGTAVRATLVAPLSQEKAFRITKRFRELGIEELMRPTE